MKLKVVLLVVFVAIARSAPGQTTAELIAQGRALLTQSNLIGAHEKFSAAVTASPSDPTANVLNAVTRLLVLPSQPSGSNFLNQLGFSAGGRNLYAWTSSLPRQVEGGSTNPSKFTNATELITQLRSSLLPAVSAALDNLSRVTNRSFILQLSSAETQLDDVTVDWGDIQVARAGLGFLEYLGYTLSTWNLPLQWEAIEALAEGGTAAFGGVLKRYPQLLTFRDPRELAPARAAFSRAADAYLAGSLFIRQRTLNVTRLFNLHEDMYSQERGFRTTIEDFRASLDHPVELREDPDITIFAARHFDGSRSLAEMLPRFEGKAILAGTVPDLTFNGLLAGLSSAEIDRALSGGWEIVPHLRVQMEGTPRFPQLRLGAEPGQSFELFHSVDLENWTPLTAVVAYDSPIALTLPADHPPANANANFYLVAPQAHAANDDFQNRTLLPSIGGDFSASFSGATREPEEPVHDGLEFMRYTIWWSWVAPLTGLLEVQSLRGYSPVAVYTGSSLDQLTPVLPIAQFDPLFEVTAGTTYQIVMAGDFNFDDRSEFRVRAFPAALNDNFADRQPILSMDQVISTHNIGSSGEPDEPLHIPFGEVETRRSIWFTWTAPKTGRFTLEVPENQNLPFFAVYTGDSLARLNLVQQNQSPSGSTVLDVTRGTVYQIALDQSYGTRFAFRIVETPAPANDRFDQAQRLTGSEVTVTASNRGATAEPGELGHADFAEAEHSLWYDWVAPATGNLRLSGVGGDMEPLIRVYTGNSVNQLEHVQRGLGGIADYYPVEKGARYRIAVDSPGDETGMFILRLLLEPMPF